MFSCFIQSFIKPIKLWSTPLWLGLEITNRCNSNCRTCTLSHNEALRRNPGHIDFQHFQAIFDQYRPKILSLTGVGESLLNDDYFRMIKYAKNNDCYVYSTTNGILIKRYASELTACGLDELTVSMDGYDNQSYHSIRGVDHYDTIINGLNSLSDNCMNNNSSMIFGFNVVVQDINYLHLDKFIDLAKATKASFVYFLPLDINTEVMSNKEYSVGVNKDSLWLSINRAFKVSKELKISTNLKYWIKYFSNIWSKMHPWENKPISARICHLPWGGIFINSYGDILPCCILTTANYSYGNFHSGPLNTIINSESAIKFRTILKKGKKPFSRCRECIVYPYREVAYDMIKNKVMKSF
jgi:radical SAM protein with 4Fe4S-binding SPASM domain